MKRFMIYYFLFGCLTSLVSAKIVFTSSLEGEDDEIYTMNDDGSNLLRLTNNLLDDIDPHWSPDGKQIAFVRIMDSEPKQTDLFLINADGSHERRLTTHPAHDGPNIAWSPDGRHIAFVSLRSRTLDIHVLNLSNGDIKKLTNGDGASTEPHWSPDGQQIAYRNTHRERGMTIYVMKADGTNQRPLLPASVGVQRYDPQWTPDSQRVLFKETEAMWVGPKLRLTATRFIIYHQAGKMRQVLREFSTNWAVQDPCWMSHNTAIVFSAKKGHEKNQLYQYHIASDSITAVTDNPRFNISPDWVSGPLDVSPEGSLHIQWGQLK